jgi:hypothetical protein
VIYVELTMEKNINVNLRIIVSFKVETFLYSPHDCATSESAPRAIQLILISSTFPFECRPHELRQFKLSQYLNQTKSLMTQTYRNLLYQNICQY